MMFLRTGDVHHRPLDGQGDERYRPYAIGRIALLYLVSRRIWQTLAGLGGIALLIWWVMSRTPTDHIDAEMLTARNETLLLHLAASLLASVIGIANWPDHFHRIPEEADDPAVQSAIDLFAALSPDAQRSWLEANWNDLSHGTLTLEDLP